MRLDLRFILPSALLWLGCGAEPMTASEGVPPDPMEVKEEQLEASMLQMGAEVDARLGRGFERRHVVDDIYQYSARLRVGGGEHDVLTLHRVVREVAPWKPARSPEGVFMVHGDVWDFTGVYLGGARMDAGGADHSVAVYLARQGVDVWGVDLRWTHVPLETQDFGFMGEWNLGTHAQDVGTGLAVARKVRRETGSGGGQVHLAGWSRGAMVGYAYLSEETRRPKGQRHVRGFIPMDMVLKFGPEAEQQRQWACARAALARQSREAGQVEGGLMGPGAGLGPMFLGLAALHDPEGIAAPPMPPMPNRQLALTMGAATFFFLSNPQFGVEPPVPFYHLVAGQFGAEGMPTGLRFAQEQGFFSRLSQARPYQSFNEVVEGEAMLCDEEDLPYDDHLAKVEVPVLYVGAAGGFGRYGIHSTTLLGSKDVSVHVVQTLPDEARVADYGHADLFLASDAATRVWAPVREWMKRH
jgi:hypothetical protein